MLCHGWYLPFFLFGLDESHGHRPITKCIKLLVVCFDDHSLIEFFIILVVW